MKEENYTQLWHNGEIRFNGKVEDPKSTIVSHKKSEEIDNISIKLKSGDEVISEINVTKDNITLKAENIDLGVDLE